MDKEGRRRFFVVISAFVEVVMPVLRKRIERDFLNKNIRTFRDFLNSKPILHTLFHLCFGGMMCCTDTINCISCRSSPIYKTQWYILFVENRSVCGRLCHCNYTANTIQLKDIDITLAATILRNCCILSPAEGKSVDTLRKYKNTLLSHHTKGTLTEPDFKEIWRVIRINIMIIDNSMEFKNDLMTMEKKTLDETLCQQYYTHCVDVFKSLEKVRQYEITF
ncbi:unnamed protein product [Mytilus coruscus]|uniref:DZIP3-like HEPN domain-containing protein n=1 Tax=Mytilus coruscus TaxID=42192 RepID=A0A6J8C6N3_MYTCO|nr:unnamed protein product [Mytilus coruscus]